MPSGIRFRATTTMISTRTSIAIASVITLAAIAVFAETYVRAVVYDPDIGIQAPSATVAHAAEADDPPANRTEASDKKASATKAPPVSPTEPSRLLIPGLHIDAAVQKTGITSKGDIGTPTNFIDAAWYMYGVAPGQPGTAIIDGHVDNGLALAGVFKHLSDIAEGDDVYVVTNGGSQLHFKVVSIAHYDYQDVPAGAIFRDTDRALLEIITCGGVWVPKDKTYNERLVVTAALVKP